MSKFINTIIGDQKNANPARKYTVYALLGTLAAFLLSVIILIASSVLFAVTDGDAPAAGDEGSDGGDGGVAINAGSIVYVNIESSDELDAKVRQDKIVKLADVRTKLSTGDVHHYYAKNDSDGVENLTEKTATALDKMMIAFYDNNKSSLVVDTGKEDCNIPLITKTSSDGFSFKVVRFNDDASVYNNSTYKWIFDNAYTYGFVYAENTFTYVGEAVANYIRSTANNGDSAKALSGIRNASNNVSTTVVDPATKKAVTYQIYYLVADASEFKVPTNYEYTVITDGSNGYFITVNMSKPVSTETQTGLG